MVVQIKSFCDDEAKGKKLKKLPNSQTFNLTKIDSVSKDFEIKKPLDPINIKKYKSKLNMHNLNLTRHRVNQ